MSEMNAMARGNGCTDRRAFIVDVADVTVVTVDALTPFLFIEAVFSQVKK